MSAPDCAQSLPGGVGWRISTTVGSRAYTLSRVPRAADECGPPPAGGGTVSCSSAGNPYPGGITYDPVVEDLTVVFQDNLPVVTDDNVFIRSVTSGVGLRLEADPPISGSVIKSYAS